MSLTRVVVLGVDVNLLQALDFDDVTGDLYAALFDDNTVAGSGLFVIDTHTGVANPLGTIGQPAQPGEPRVPAMAVGPRPCGACCFGDGSYAPNITHYECELFFGLYAGDDFDCGSAQCPQPGACCLPIPPPGAMGPMFAPSQDSSTSGSGSDNCEEIIEPACNQVGGVFQGEHVLCSGDSDGDGFSDNCEQCPGDPEKTEPGVCGCGVPDIDSDNDGLLDCVDDYPFASDVNGNGYIDHQDMAEMFLCMNGPDVPPPWQECLCFDVDKDGDVDIFDVYELTPVYGSP